MLVNKTPHAVSVADSDGKVIRTIEATPPACRVKSESRPGAPLDGVPFVETVFGEIENLPAPEEGVWYIVSQIVIAAANGRPDLVRPDSGPTAVRDAEGRMIACRALTR
jgi:hypothetical protein